jgi:hypothetical protein
MNSWFLQIRDQGISDGKYRANAFPALSIHRILTDITD